MNYKISEKCSEINDNRLMHYIDIEFNMQFYENENIIDYIIFKNFYTHIIDIFQFVDDEWKSIICAYKLMNDPECEEDAEKYFIINKKQFTNIIKTNKLRIYLYQESKIWKDFKLTNLRFFNEKEIFEIKNKNTADKIEIANNLHLILNEEEIRLKYLEISKFNNDNLNYKIFN